MKRNVIKRVMAIALAAITVAASAVSASAYELIDFNNAKLKAGYYYVKDNVPEISTVDLYNHNKIVYTNISGSLTEGKEVLYIRPAYKLPYEENIEVVDDLLPDFKLLNASGKQLSTNYPLVATPTWDGGFKVIVGSNTMFCGADVWFMNTSQLKSGKTNTLDLFIIIESNAGAIVGRPEIKVGNYKCQFTDVNYANLDQDNWDCGTGTDYSLSVTIPRSNTVKKLPVTINGVCCGYFTDPRL